MTPRLDALFGALSDPTRRQLIERLTRDGPATASELSDDLPMTRQAVVKHLQTLNAAGLVGATRAGREVRFAASPSALEDAMAWMKAASAGWDRRLDRLRRHLANP